METDRDNSNTIHRSKGELNLTQYFPDYLCWDELYLTFISLEPMAAKISRYNLIEDTIKHLLIELAGIELGLVTPIWKGHRRGLIVELTDLVHSCDDYKGADTTAAKLVSDFIHSITALPETGWQSPALTSRHKQNQKKDRTLELKCPEFSIFDDHDAPNSQATLPQEE